MFRTFYEFLHDPHLPALLFPPANAKIPLWGKFSDFMLDRFALALFLAFFAWAAPSPISSRSSSQASPSPSNTNAPVATKPVVIELFTSEGCSSCPPADALLTKLQGSSAIPGIDVIGLEEHVDYWNHQGWTDPFSSPEWTQRQVDYQPYLGLKADAVYTPQFVLDGSAELVHSAPAEMLAQITNAAKQLQFEVVVKSSASQKNAQSFAVSVAAIANEPRGPADIFLAIAESGLHSNVSAGENSGRELFHAPVLRRLVKIGSLGAKDDAFKADPTIKLDSPWRRDNLQVIVFVQDKKSRHILGAAEVPVSGSPS